MLDVLANRSFRHLFAAQAVALVGTGLATVALGLLAFELAGSDAGMVLGTALAIKMLAYVGVAPVAAAFADVLPRRTMLVALDLVRAAVALMLPFVSQVWQVYVLIFVLQAASAAFTPSFQAAIAEVLPQEQTYTRALSLSRLAYDLESLVSPVLAAALLTVLAFNDLFAGTAVGFIASGALVLSTALPAHRTPQRRSIYDRTTRGLRIYLATPRLRGLLAIHAAVAAAGSMVFVNTVVLVQGRFGLGQSDVAWALASFGAGSMVAALALPALLEKLPDRTAMLGGVGLMAVALFLGAGAGELAFLMALWFVIGLGYSTAQTPSGRLLRRSAHPEDRPALFAAQFALSHACWLLFYPLAGWLGTRHGMPMTFAILGGAGVVGAFVALRVWPARDPEVVEHEHLNPTAWDVHAQGAARTGNGVRHAHAFVIDDQHPHWPGRAG